jgi:hypothetical protein
MVKGTNEWLKKMEKHNTCTHYLKIYLSQLASKVLKLLQGLSVVTVMLNKIPNQTYQALSKETMQTCKGGRFTAAEIPRECLKKLEYLSLVSNVCTESESHIGTNKVLADTP